jgi:hypothetical protein
LSERISTQSYAAVGGGIVISAACRGRRGLYGSAARLEPNELDEAEHVLAAVYSDCLRWLLEDDQLAREGAS